MNYHGLYLLLLIFGCMGFTFVVNPFLKKKILNSYFSWVVIALSLLVYFIVFRYSDHVKEYLEIYPSITNNIKFAPSSKENSYLATLPALVFLTDICPFCYISLCFSLIFDPSRKIVRFVSPLALTSALLTMCFALPWSNSFSVQFNANFIFFGNSNGKLYYFLHTSNILLSLMVLLNTPRVKKNWIIGFIFFIAILYIHSLIFMVIFDIRFNCCTISAQDWFNEYGELHEIPAILAKIGVPVVVAPIISVFVLYMITGLVMWLFNAIKSTAQYRYPEIKSLKWYKGYNFNIEQNISYQFAK